MGLGDEILASGHAQHVFDKDPSKRVAICDKQGRPRWHELWEGNPIIAKPEQVAAGEPVHRLINGSNCRPYIKSLSVDAGLQCTDWKAADHVGRLYLTKAELAAGHDLAKRLGPYIVIEPGLKLKASRNKLWGAERYQAVVDALPELRFAQMTHAGSTLLRGVSGMAMATFRQACGVLASASAYVGAEGGLHHAAAALGIPAVVIFGGFISPNVTGYPWHMNLADDGPGSPCGKWKPCEHCRMAMEGITVNRVVMAIHLIMSAKRMMLSA
jgi:Glycosyltransferase family 9 (heptosyltransferase)